MKTMVKLLAVLVLVLGTLGVSVPAALAAPPDNDTFTGATPVSVGFSEEIGTEEATADADDAQLNNSCGFPATDASVWYVFTAGSDQVVLVDVQSDYYATVMVGELVGGSLQAVTCGGQGFYATENATYYVLVIDPQYDGGGNGGNLSISFNEAPPPPTVDFTVNPSGAVSGQTGVAVISGSYTCTNGSFIEAYGEARQNVGRLSTIVGPFSVLDSGTCDGAPHQWETKVVPFSGKFAGGVLQTRIFYVYSCGAFECAQMSDIEQQVKLKGGPKK